VAIVIEQAEVLAAKVAACWAIQMELATSARTAHSAVTRKQPGRVASGSSPLPFSTGTGHSTGHAKASPTLRSAGVAIPVPLRFLST
jgi:hypothetical protein